MQTDSLNHYNLVMNKIETVLPANLKKLYLVSVALYCFIECVFLQVEYSYPPLLPGRPVDSSDIPDEWKQLPSLALPDGAHNFTEGEAKCCRIY